MGVESATVDSKSLIMAMSQVITRVDEMTSILGLFFILITLLTILGEGTLKDKASPRLITLINLMGNIGDLVILIWIYSLNSLVYWVRPDGTEDNILKISARVMIIFLDFYIIYDAVKLWRMPTEIPVLILDPMHMRGYKATNDQPFIYPYREGTGENSGNRATETNAVVSGNEV